ncbi:MAG TPA: hypothetical protein VN886_18690 [Acidimicrobiales bacterium]|nr:hypothetical protein [Acidimicrobiales bacterium]
MRSIRFDPICRFIHPKNEADSESHSAAPFRQMLSTETWEVPLSLAGECVSERLDRIPTGFFWRHRIGDSLGDSVIELPLQTNQESLGRIFGSSRRYWGSH